MSAQLSLAYRSEGSDKSSPTRQDKCLPIKEEAQDLEVLLSSSAMAASHCVLLAFLSVVLLVEAGVVPDEPETRINGGKLIEYSEAPWMVFMNMFNPEDNLTYQCGGSIIHKDWVLTAAHCTEPYDKHNLILRIGSKYANGGGTTYNVERVVLHEDYNKKLFRNDVSLMKTDKSIPLGNLMKAIRLPAEGTRAKIGIQVIATGWGLKEDGLPSELLRAVAIKTRPITDCRHLDQFTDASTQLCAGLSGKDACKGDSGGPLVQGGVVVGMVSYSFNETCATRPGVYTDVGVYVRWIKKHVQL